MKIAKTRHIALIVVIFSVLTALAQDNDRILNRPYADQKKLHFGFSVGMNFQDLNITNNGFVTEDGEAWFADIPKHSPGFSVTVLADWRISKHFNFRLSPGMYFGNKVVKYVNANADPEALEPSHVQQSQNLKATYVVLPAEIKFSALRYRNLRPYFTGGVMGIYDVSKNHPDQLRVKDFDVMLTVGLGCDIYLPFFKLCPELKFCFGLRNLIEKKRPDLEDNPEMMRFTQSIDKVKNNMVVLSFYFE